MKTKLIIILTVALTLFNINVNAQIITTVAGNGTYGYSGDLGQATAAELNEPVAINFDATGNMYIADLTANLIRKINTAGIITTIAGDTTGVNIGTNYGYNGDGILATTAKLNYPADIAFDALGNLYISDQYNERIRKVNTSGIIATVAGNGTQGYSGDGAFATAAKLSLPGGLAFDALGNLYIADGGNNCIRMINTLGNISTIAGNGATNYSGDNGYATAAALNRPTSLAFDVSGNLYIADTYNNLIRKVNTLGIITTVAGDTTGVNAGTNYGYSGDGMLATTAKLNFPSDVSLDALGNLYISDQYNERIRKVNTSGVITTVAGNGTQGYSGDGYAATTAELNILSGLASDAACNLYIADSRNGRIRKITSASSAGVNELRSISSELRVYPNPSSAIFIVVPNQDLNLDWAKSQIEVYNIVGECIHRVTAASSNYQIDLSSQPDGVYFINFKIDNKQYMKKAIKN
jgi:sugar lactone lactonase YvrE